MRIGIIGTGYVGLVSAACFAEMGNHVVCVDKNPAIVQSLEKGVVHIYEPGLEELVTRNHTDGRLSFTTDLAAGIAGADVVFICVGTPPKEDNSCDLTFVMQVAKEIGSTMEDPLVVVDKSTVPVGTADAVSGVIAEELARRGRAIPYTVVSNPEFLKEGDAVNDFMKPDRVIVGTESPEAADLMKTLYAPFARSRDKLITMAVRSAEMTKYAANCMLATKISFINEMSSICERVGADISDVRVGIGSDHRIGYHFIYPGLGYGGSCFPKDVKALIHTSRVAGVEPHILEAVERVNTVQKAKMARRILEYFDQQGGVKGKTLAMWGLAFKANTDDMREAASLVMVEELTRAGMRIVAYDPEATRNATRIFAGNPLFSVAKSAYAALPGASALLVATEWNQFRTPDFQAIKNALEAPVIFDGRNLYSGRELARKGFAYFCIGKPDRR